MKVKEVRVASHLLIIGAGGHGKVVADAAEAAGWQSIEFVDERWEQINLNNRWNVSGDLDAALARSDGVIVAIGNNATRLKVVIDLKRRGAPLVNVIHPSAVVSSYVTMGVANVLVAGAILNIDVMLGDACIINTAASIDHDCSLGDAVHVSPGAHLAGEASVGDRTWIGIGAVVKECVSVGHDAIVGAGAAVIADVAADRVVIGVPATRV
ncbi:NeuD/PglB/VioB family sugar acetyltransferase [Aestuariirhabdus sp. Z084]|uniref:NeuD/PglB/VioB family sugar acetyltransferase n=1 Tax=Aestuariirhabdus haliotis TaxID=2918751 RepID=UPI0020BF2A06|nr:NeuD/PglB/VioB family sugar acetyltransferase [Aestuariirhabdus haliotis]MCL6415809.1 NeuD/PglB/VioB family sugar acetyltransferase [Aestuariirhabdus haliotis]